MQHITLTTGDVRWSPREEVDGALMGVLVDHLAAALRGRAPIPRKADYATHATTERNVLMATVSRRHGRDWMPVLTMAVVPADGDAGTIGGLMLGTAPTPLPNVPRPGPWCLVRLYDTAVLVPPADLAWVGDYERCLAWAWLESGTASRRSH